MYNNRYNLSMSYNYWIQFQQLSSIAVVIWCLKLFIALLDSVSNNPTYGARLVLGGLGEMFIPCLWSHMKLRSVRTAITISICEFKLIWGIRLSTIFHVCFNTPNVRSITPRNTWMPVIEQLFHTLRTIAAFNTIEEFGKVVANIISKVRS